MLTQSEADALIAVPKRMLEQGLIELPSRGQRKCYPAKSVDGRSDFLFDVRVSGVRVTNRTCQERAHVSEVLLRLDMDGPPHDNPDGQEIVGPHLHVYREGFAARWAYPVPAEILRYGHLLPDILHGFLEYCNVVDIPSIQGGLPI